VLRGFEATDLRMALDLSTDPYAPLVGTMPSHATEAEAADWIERQQSRWAEGAGFSFAIAEAATGRAVGAAGLWLRQLPEGRATAGYFVAPADRGHGLAAAALTAITAFGWTIPQLYRIELYIEPGNSASVRTAENAGYLREGLLRSHTEIGGRRHDMLLFAAVRG
jgi:ribosomal-protein-alanine N-acetyltransferase